MKTWLSAFVVCVLILTGANAQAAPRRVSRPYTPRYSTAQSPFSRFMEFERRKNAALRSMFFGG